LTVYAIRKRRGQWAVCSEENVLLQFETYDEAVEVARSAAEVLRARARDAAPLHEHAHTIDHKDKRVRGAA
jgi:hypothetical protein